MAGEKEEEMTCSSAKSRKSWKRLLIPLDLLRFSAEEMACSFGEEQWLISSGGQRKYGTTSSHTTRRERLIQYDVQENDTLQGIALKFNVTMEQLKRANKLWTNDSLHVRRTLLVPLPLEPSGGTTAAVCSSDSDEAGSSSGGSGGGTAGEPRRPGRGQLPSADDFLRQVDSVIASSRRSVSRLRVD
ncbi:lysM and putative peptidoglycan-binding domain-containing protein 1-like isoform X2 [Amphibalanus amphitrite]|uniref:lysM and putative peptidoglycan-binding domain-containing protein 1-like isoform X2 n=1 Tax=Amphibalanus amphitrite TaxID=1232801 RepID=UPI001C8FB8EC|nr:lysM and putative peptidoglycan-binding domain-containing protein 1-like isoform X2 [Amphibalanus amphitrite]